MVFVMFVLLVCFLCFYSFSEVREVTFVQCVDGDTAWFLIDGKKEKVRFLAIDAPEIAHDDKDADYYGDNASEYVCKVLKDAKSISLEYDVHSEVRDKYDRLLAWVFIDGENLNQLLVERGYAMVRYVYGDYSYLDDLCDSQEKAYDKKLGIWKYEQNNYMDSYCYKKNT